MRLEALIASAGRSLLSELPRVCVTAWPDSAVSVLCCGFCWGSVCLRGMFPVYRGGGSGLGASFLLSRAGIFCGFVCGGVCLSEYDTPKTAIFSDLDYFFVDYLFN